MWNVIYLCRPPRRFDGGVYQRVSTQAHQTLCDKNNKHYATNANAAG